VSETNAPDRLSVLLSIFLPGFIQRLLVPRRKG
jgi:hypothetical protein